MALPTTGITTTLVGTTLGVATRNVGTLCTSDKVNRWSKRKPVRYSGVTGEKPPYYYENINYGINVKSFANITSVIQGYLDNVEMWEYLKPRGGAYDEPFRIGDFREYEHLSISPIAGSIVTPRVSNVATTSNIMSGALMINSSPSQYEIGWEDLNLQGRRLMLVLTTYTMGGIGTIVRTAVGNVGDTIVDIDVRKPTVLSEGFYKAYLMLSNPSGTTNPNVAGIPNHPIGGFDVQIVAHLVTIGVAARWDKQTNNIIIEVECYNASGGSVLLQNCHIRIRNHANSCDSTIQINEQLIQIGDITAVSGRSTIYQDTVTVPRDYYSTWKVCWSNLGAYPYTVEAAIIQEME